MLTPASGVVAVAVGNPGPVSIVVVTHGVAGLAIVADTVRGAGLHQRLVLRADLARYPAGPVAAASRRRQRAGHLGDRLPASAAGRGCSLGCC
ncbi:MAG TPA: hypothetical protein VE645_03450 [Pseudonocardiaceae bacterium]|nr:hypothetical protein [Pseudonocardiaceae bacterium]